MNTETNTFQQWKRKHIDWYLTSLKKEGDVHVAHAMNKQGKTFNFRATTEQDALDKVAEFFGEPTFSQWQSKLEGANHD